MALLKPEALLQRDVRTILILLGYTVLETGKSRSKTACSSCGKRSYATGWQGNTPGLPDLYVHCKHWPLPFAIAMELKAANGKPSEAQKALADSGQTKIIRSVEDALRLLRRMEAHLGDAKRVEVIDRVIYDVESKGKTE